MEVVALAQSLVGRAGGCCLHASRAGRVTGPLGLSAPNPPRLPAPGLPAPGPSGLPLPGLPPGMLPQRAYDFCEALARRISGMHCCCCHLGNELYTIYTLYILLLPPRERTLENIITSCTELLNLEI